MRTAASLVTFWLPFVLVVACHCSAHVPPISHAFAVAFVSPNNYDRISNTGSLNLSWSCAPVNGSSPSHFLDEQQPKLVISIHNEIIHSQVPVAARAASVFLG
jgi:hypothetical protein